MHGKRPFTPLLFVIIFCLFVTRAEWIRRKKKTIYTDGYGNKVLLYTTTAAAAAAVTTTTTTN